MKKIIAALCTAVVILAVGGFVGKGFLNNPPPAPEVPLSGETEASRASGITEESGNTEKFQGSGDAAAAAENEAVSEIFVQKNTDGTGDGFKKLMESMLAKGFSFYKTGDFDRGMIDKNDVVLIKINCQWDQRGGTNTDLLKSVIQAVVDHPGKFEGEVVIADNGQGQYGSRGTGGSLDWENTNSRDKTQSARDVANYFEGKGFKVSGVLWDEFTKTQVKEYEDGDYGDGFVLENEKKSTGLQISYAKFKTKFGTLVSFKNGIWDDNSKKYDPSRLKVINMPVLKPHMLYQVTGAVKSYMGTTSDKLTRTDAHNSIGNGGMGTQMASTRVPVLNILDAIWVGTERGPMMPYSGAAEMGIIAAGTDPVALDYWASKNILMAAAKKSGNRRYEAMDPDGKEPGTFGYWLGLSAAELQKAGIKAILDETKIRVYISE